MPHLCRTSSEKLRTPSRRFECGHSPKSENTVTGPRQLSPFFESYRLTSASVQLRGKHLRQFAPSALTNARDLPSS